MAAEQNTAPAEAGHKIPEEAWGAAIGAALDIVNEVPMTSYTEQDEFVRLRWKAVSVGMIAATILETIDTRLQGGQVRMHTSSAESGCKTCLKPCRRKPAIDGPAEVVP